MLILIASSILRRTMTVAAARVLALRLLAQATMTETAVTVELRVTVTLIKVLTLRLIPRSKMPTRDLIQVVTIMLWTSTSSQTTTACLSTQTTQTSFQNVNEPTP